MSDDRFLENEFSYKSDKQYITLREYVKRVMQNQPERSEELKSLIKVFGAESIEKVVESNYEIKVEMLWKKDINN